MIPVKVRLLRCRLFVFLLIIFMVGYFPKEISSYGYYQPFTIPLSLPPSFYSSSSSSSSSNSQGSSSIRLPTFLNLQSRHFSLPPMSKVSETLGAINTLGRYILKKTRTPIPQLTPRPWQNQNQQNSNGYESSGEYLGESSSEDLHSASSQNDKISSPVLNVKPEEDERLGEALYTLGRNVLGQNVTDTLVPVMQTVNQIGKFLPPLVYRDGRIILGNSANSTNDGGEIRDVICTTPLRQPGKCLDLSGCPSLLFDLSNLRKSLCFKALFIPGVCCPDKDSPGATKRPIIVETEPTTTRRPAIIHHRPISNEDSVYPTIVTKRPSIFVDPTFSIPTEQAKECGRPEMPSFRIVGGDKSTPGMWPWMAAIFLHGPKGTEFWCGGSLISKRYILTAAHCTKDQKQKSFSPRQFTVRLGDYDLVRTDDLSAPEIFRVVEIISHSDFSGMGFYNDVALLKLDREVDYNRFISPVCLPTARSTLNNFVGEYPTVIGWGTNKYGGREHKILQEVKLPVWSNDDCDRTYFQPITDIFLCAGLPQGGKDACQGDSGGPLMLEMDQGRWTQIGIVSFGNRCAEPGYPGVYTRITKFLDWINTNAI